MNAYNGITGMQEARNDEWSAEKIVYNMDVDPRLASLISENCECRLYNLHFGGLFYLEKWLY